MLKVSFCCLTTQKVSRRHLKLNVKGKSETGDSRELNARPLAPQTRIISLDHCPANDTEYFFVCFDNMKRFKTSIERYL